MPRAVARRNRNYPHVLLNAIVGDHENQFVAVISAKRMSTASAVIRLQLFAVQPTIPNISTKHRNL